MSQIKTAPVDMFTTLRPRLLVGRLLKDIKAIQASISRFGLLSPIIVTRSNSRLIVVDGRKRLAAIRRLEFMGCLPRSLVNIPFIELEDARQSHSDTPALMSNRDLFKTVIDLFKTHQDVSVVAAKLYLSHKCVKQVLTLARLSPRLRQIFFNGTISFEQAKAYAALPQHKIQNRAFMTLGPFADTRAILDYASRPVPPVTTPMRVAA